MVSHQLYLSLACFSEVVWVQLPLAWLVGAQTVCVLITMGLESAAELLKLENEEGAGDASGQKLALGGAKAGACAESRLRGLGHAGAYVREVWRARALQPFGSQDHCN